jgi:hypothetical protein
MEANELTMEAQDGRQWELSDEELEDMRGGVLAVFTMPPLPPAPFCNRGA